MELVKVSQIQIGADNVNAVNARDLWKALDSKQEFSHWIKNRIDKLGLIESRDYGVFDKIIKNTEWGGRRNVVSIKLWKRKQI